MRAQLAIMIGLIALAPQSAMARGTSEEKGHALSASAGISAPSLTTYGENNPAGLVYNRYPKLLGLVSGGTRTDNYVRTSGQFYTGNGLIGANLGVESANNLRDETGSLTSFNFGLGTWIEGIDLAMGMNGKYRVQMKDSLAAAGAEKTWTANFGLLYNPHGMFRLGATVYDITNGISAFGTGLAIHLNHNSILSVDASTNRSGQGLTVKPGLTIISDIFQLTYSYGIQIDKSNMSAINPGNTIGVAIDITPTLQIQTYYNQYSLFSLGASFSL